MEKLGRIQKAPKMCFGQSVVRGTRITGSLILKSWLLPKVTAWQPSDFASR